MVDWFFSRGYTKYSTNGLRYSARIDMLNYLYDASIANPNIKFVYDAQSISITDPDITELQWFWDRREQLPFLFTSEIFYSIRRMKDDNVIIALQWWYDRKDQYGIDKLFVAPAIDILISNAFMDFKKPIIDWLVQRDISYEITKDIVDAVVYTTIEQFKFIYDEFIRKSPDGIFPYDEDTINRIAVTNRVDMLDFFELNGLEIKHTEKIIHSASQKGNTAVLQWFYDRKSTSGFKYSHCHFIRSHVDSNYRNIHWWRNSGLPIKTIESDIYMVHPDRALWKKMKVDYIQNATDELECPICLTETESLIKLACGHSFHKSCFDMWHETNKNCPYCRSPVDKVIIFIE
jgi:hypothetical protein